MEKENEFYVDSEKLSPKALEKKHRLESDPSSRTDHMAYLPDMEQIDSDVMKKVMAHMDTYDASAYTAKDVRAALQHDRCTVDDFKALISPAAEPFLEEMAQKDKKPAVALCGKKDADSTGSDPGTKKAEGSQ